MTPKAIILSSVGKTNTPVVLDSLLLTLALVWNELGKFWTLDIKDPLGDLLVAGIVLVPNQPLLQRYPAVAALVGEFVVAERTAGAYQVRENMGTDVVLLWFPPGEEVVIP